MLDTLQKILSGEIQVVLDETRVRVINEVFDFLKKNDRNFEVILNSPLKMAEKQLLDVKSGNVSPGRQLEILKNAEENFQRALTYTKDGEKDNFSWINFHIGLCNLLLGEKKLAEDYFKKSFDIASKKFESEFRKLSIFFWMFCVILYIPVFLITGVIIVFILGFLLTTVKNIFSWNIFTMPRDFFQKILYWIQNLSDPFSGVYGIILFIVKGFFAIIFLVVLIFALKSAGELTFLLTKFIFGSIGKKFARNRTQNSNQIMKSIFTIYDPKSQTLFVDKIDKNLDVYFDLNLPQNIVSNSGLSVLNEP